MSKKYNLNKEDGIKIAKGAGIAVSAALLTYLSQVVTQIDFGEYTAIVVGIASILINAGRKLIENKEWTYIYLRGKD